MDWDEPYPPTTGEVNRLLDEAQHYLENGDVKKIEKLSKDDLIGAVEEAYNCIKLARAEFEEGLRWTERAIGEED